MKIRLWPDRGPWLLTPGITVYIGSMTIIADNTELAAFCARQATADYIAVDTEFLRDTTYWPQLCLVQIGGPDEVAAIDTLAPDIDLTPIYALMDKPDLLKVFHSARQDLEIFYNLMGHVPGPVFDTQVAAMVCGFGDSVGYDTLIRKLTGEHIDKSSRFADWSHRPLSTKQLNYALSDVIHLRPAFEKLKRRVDNSGRAAWLDEEMATLTSDNTYRMDPENAWARLKTRSNDPRYFGILKELAAWREREAQRRNTPRNRVLRDEQLFDIAAHRPTDADALGRTRGLSRDVANGRIGQGILTAIKQGLAIPKADCPSPPRKPDLPNGLGPVIDLLKVLLKMKCEKHDVAQKLIANTADLEYIAADDNAPVPALSGWRRELFGEDALALKNGRLALTTRNRKIRVVPLGGEDAR